LSGLINIVTCRFIVQIVIFVYYSVVFQPKNNIKNFAKKKYFKHRDTSIQRIPNGLGKGY